MFLLFFKLKNQKPSSPPVLSIIDLQPPVTVVATASDGFAQFCHDSLGADRGWSSSTAPSRSRSRFSRKRA
ncbi:hypothetical protein TorRG33x02_058590 [Trema orientale]|uniref:Uncharacterized protein n=1 Tax=Trema orientale TaxID=63057 RepID=A0A2P5FKI9_TREOI|nr:hypothetical protein TorRG33x02_058590 [Trema orientale]